MKLISLNIEGQRHHKDVFNFIQTENPDVLCLMEAPEETISRLELLNYKVAFAPICKKEQDGKQFTMGVLLATKGNHSAETHYYHHSAEDIKQFDRDHYFETTANPVIVVEYEGFHIATTHFTWNPIGENYSELQDLSLTKLRDFLAKLPPHILCGDFNLPRYINPLHPSLVDGYFDAIPTHYKSSLDRTKHRVGADPTKAILFDSFMVDYLLTQLPYQATDVRLEFGVSDHAAVVGTISIMK